MCQILIGQLKKKEAKQAPTTQHVNIPVYKPYPSSITHYLFIIYYYFIFLHRSQSWARKSGMSSSMPIHSASVRRYPVWCQMHLN